MKILVSDYDGTLKLPAPIAVSEQLLVDLQKWQEAGNLFWLATGRSAVSIQKEQEVYPSLSFQYLIGCNGAFICDREYRVLFASKIERQTVEALINFVKDFSFNSIVLTSGLKRVQVSRQEMLEHPELQALIAEDEIVQIVINFEQDQPIIDHYQQEICQKIGLNPLRNNRCLDIVRQGIDKRTGIDFLLKHLQYTEQPDIICVGDGENDVCMLRNYRGYLMANARPQLLEKFSDQVSSVSQLISQEMGEV